MNNARKSIGNAQCAWTLQLIKFPIFFHTTDTISARPIFQYIGDGSDVVRLNKNARDIKSLTTNSNRNYQKMHFTCLDDKSLHIPKILNSQNWQIECQNTLSRQVISLDYFPFHLSSIFRVHMMRDMQESSFATAFYYITIIVVDRCLPNTWWVSVPRRAAAIRAEFWVGSFRMIRLCNWVRKQHMDACLLTVSQNWRKNVLFQSSVSCSGSRCKINGYKGVSLRVIR